MNGDGIYLMDFNGMLLLSKTKRSVGICGHTTQQSNGSIEHRGNNYIVISMEIPPKIMEGISTQGSYGQHETSDAQ